MRHSLLQCLTLQCSAFSVVAVVSSAALAGDPATCAAIAEDHARLACYDAAFTFERPGTAPRDATTDSRAPLAADAQPQGSADQPAADERSLIGERWSRYEPASGYPFLVRLHNANYVMLRHSNRVNVAPVSPAHPDADTSRDIERDELKFQVSFKSRLWESSDRRYATWLGYTQQSNWQALNAPQSRPFRESDYQPELMFVMQPDRALIGGLRWQLLNVGLVHQSNGLSDPGSRSWNRIYAQFGVEDDHFAGGKLAILARPWVRLHERSTRDDNPDITDYLGYGDLTLLWRRGEQTLTFTGRANPRTRKGAAQIEWSAPAIGAFRYYVQVFTGYGESLIDYNFRQTVFGAGFSLNDLF
jgi:phospholipase A1/A2